MVSATEAIVVVMRPAGRKGRSTSVSLTTPTTPGDQERDRGGRQQRQPQPHIGAVAGKRADRRMRRDGEVRKPQHGVDRGEADRRRGQDRAGHHAVERRAGDVGQHVRR